MNSGSRVPLNDEVDIPLLGFGTYLIDDSEAERTVATAIRAGYRHIDTAEGYRNEDGVGEAIRGCMESEGLGRDDVFVTTKLWPGNAAWGQPPKSHDATLDSLDASLSRLGLGYVDLYLIHAPHNVDERLDQWRALVDLQAQGKALAIGVSNYNRAHIEEIREAGLPLPDANQIELHPWSQKPDLVTYLEDNDIVPIAYSSLVPLSTWRAAEGQRSGKSQEMRADGDAEDSPFRRIASKNGVSEARVLLRWGVQKGYPVLPKSTNTDRIRENADLFSFELDQVDMAELDELDRGPGVAWGSGDPLLVP